MASGSSLSIPQGFTDPYDLWALVPVTSPITLQFGWVGSQRHEQGLGNYEKAGKDRLS